MSNRFLRIVNLAIRGISRNLASLNKDDLAKRHVCKTLLSTITLLGAVACSINGHATQNSLVGELPSTLAPLVTDIETIVMRFYPDGDISQPNAQTIAFRSNSRIFMMHTRDKIGNWQDAVSVVGPKPMGIVGTISIHNGGWQGAAVLPQQFDHFYFNEYVNAIQLRRTNAHVYVSIRFPKPYPKDFMIELETVLKQFSDRE